MNNLQEKIRLDEKEVKYKEVVDAISAWVNKSMVINRQVIVVKNNELPIDVTIPKREELRNYDKYTGLEYVIATALSVGVKIGEQKKEEEILGGVAKQVEDDRIVFKFK